MIKINIGCGGRPLKEYINIDMDTKEELEKRYLNLKITDDIILKQYDIYNLPFADNEVDEILCEALIEHIPFTHEEAFFREIARVLKINGKLYISTPNFEKTAKQWLEAEDDWKDFFKNDDKSISDQHWFGTYTYEPNNRWGYLTAMIFGSQNGEGQFHHNCYTEKKIKKIIQKINLKLVSVEYFRWKGNRDHMLGVNITK